MKASFFIPLASLYFAIVIAQFAGNDKAPFLVLFVAGINAIIAFSSMIAALVGKTSFFSFFILALPTLYIVLVFIGAKAGMLDSQIFLGFR